MCVLVDGRSWTARNVADRTNASKLGASSGMGIISLIRKDVMDIGVGKTKWLL